MRKDWIDNLRWVTVLLVLLYHVVYFYNNKGVFGGIGGFGDGPQYQDAVMYILYPWIMPMFFMLAGISARYALERHSGREWFKARTRKLLVPATVGLFVFQWMTGYFNTAVTGYVNGAPMLPEGVSGVVKYFAWSLSGIGPLWFIQDLWLFSALLLLVRGLDARDRLYTWCGKANIVVIVLLGVLFWVGEHTLIMSPRPETADGLWNLYKPLFYLIPFMMGYFVFSHDAVQEKVKTAWIPLMACAIVSGVALTATTFGQDNTSPQYLGSPLNCLYGYLMCLAMIGWFAAKWDWTGKFAGYLTRSSYGIYIVHYLVIASLGYMMKAYTQLPPWSMYAILTAAVFIVSPLLYEMFHRIPFIRWCVFGEKGTRTIKR